MDTWQLLLTILFSSVIGLSFGYWITMRRNHSAITLCKDLEEKLELTELELKNYQGNVAEHFTESAKLINNLTDSYKEVHEHMIKGVNTLYHKEKTIPTLKTGELKDLQCLELDSSEANIPSLQMEEAVMATKAPDLKSSEPEDASQSLADEKKQAAESHI